MFLFRFLLLAIVAYVLFKWLWKDDKNKQKKSSFSHGDKVVEEMKQDPVCGTYIPASLAVTATRKGVTVYFCSAACRDKFNEHTKTI